jgi:hypothetical protein
MPTEGNVQHGTILIRVLAGKIRQRVEKRKPQAATDLFRDDGTYQVTPFVEPMRGRTAIYEYWTHVAETERNIQFGYEVLVLTSEAGIARW